MWLFPSRPTDPFALPRRRWRPQMARLAPQTLVPWLSAVALLALVLVPMSLLFWLIFFTEVFVVQAITVTDARDHTTAAAKALIAEHLGKAALRKNILFIQSDAIEQRLLAALPQVRTVHITRKLPGTIKAIIQEKTAVMLLLSNGKYYFVDEQGIAYEEARLETLPGTVLLIVKNNDASSVVTVGVSVVAKSFVEFVQYMEKELPAAVTATVVEIRIPSLAAREVHLLLSNNWTIRFDVTRPAPTQLTTLKKLLAGTISLEEQRQLEYIDMRIPDRVYYKTSAPVAPTATPTASGTASE